MIAGPTVPIRTMRKALSYSIGALSAAIAADLDRSDDDRAFFTAERAKLEPLATQLKGVHLSLDELDLGPSAVLQATVEIGDDVLDRGVRDANARTKLGLKGKPGLDATHAFGQRVDELINTPLASEPAAVLAAVARMNDLPPFEEKAALQQDLTRRADKQEEFLKARDEGEANRTRLASEGARLVVESALALASLKGHLDARFPRQRSYVSSFFLDVAAKAKKRGAGEPNDEP
jgi:hypothetical protein